MSAPDASHAAHLMLALEKKELGNSAFKKGDMNTALRFYHESILYCLAITHSKSSLSGILGSSQPQKKSPVELEAHSLLISIYSNQAACHTKLEKWNRVIQCCEKALQLDENHIKSLYRKGLALRHLKRVESAIEVLRRGLALSPGEASIVRELQACQDLERAAEAKQKQEFKGFFGRGAVY
ncbi:hypothetical protein BC828DRAFT_381611 [Blastocladiella britannica]|nr:hypothetical protein BC828DRAFT_381611 [Blastocladiella britannica]